MSSRIVRQNHRRVARRIDCERDQLDVRHLGDRILHFMHLRSHARAWTWTGGVNKIRYPDLPGENSAVEWLAILSDQIERRNAIVDRQRTGMPNATYKRENASSEHVKLHAACSNSTTPYKTCRYPPHATITRLTVH